MSQNKLFVDMETSLYALYHRDVRPASFVAATVAFIVATRKFNHHQKKKS